MKVLRYVVISILTLLFGMLAKAEVAPDICDMQAAIQYCRNSAIEGPEGIWEFVDDETQVLIRKSAAGRKGYDIIVITTPDCRLKAGDVIGHLNPSSTRGKYKLSLHTSRSKGIFESTRNCVAEFSDKDDSIHVHPMKIKLSMRTMWFLPKFWRSLRISFKNPAAELPLGLLRIFPQSKPHTPLYL